MKNKKFEKKVSVPNSNKIRKKKINTTRQVRLSDEALDIVKLEAVKKRTTMKDYIEELIYKDYERRKKRENSKS